MNYISAVNAAVNSSAALSSVTGIKDVKDNGVTGVQDNFADILNTVMNSKKDSSFTKEIIAPQTDYASELDQLRLTLTNEIISQSISSYNEIMDMQI